MRPGCLPQPVRQQRLLEIATEALPDSGAYAGLQGWLGTPALALSLELSDARTEGLKKAQWEDLCLVGFGACRVWLGIHWVGLHKCWQEGCEAYGTRRLYRDSSLTLKVLLPYGHWEAWSWWQGQEDASECRSAEACKFWPWKKKHGKLRTSCFWLSVFTRAAGANCSFPGMYFCAPNTQPTHRKFVTKGGLKLISSAIFGCFEYSWGVSGSSILGTNDMFWGLKTTIFPSFEARSLSRRDGPSELQTLSSEYLSSHLEAVKIRVQGGDFSCQMDD